MPQTIREGVVITVSSALIITAILGVLALGLTAISEGWVVREMGGLTPSDLTAYATKDEIPDVSDLAYKSDIPNVSAFLTQSDLTAYATKDEIPDVSDLAYKSDIPNVSPFLRRDEIPKLGTTTQRLNLTRFDWRLERSKELTKAKLSPDAAFCFLTRVGGSFAGFGELIKIYKTSDGWYLDVKNGSGGGLAIEVTCAELVTSPQ